MTESRKTKVGVIGCGKISAAYFKAGKTFENLDIVACSDLDPEKAVNSAESFGIPRACSVSELLADSNIEIVINLTLPRAHAEVALAALSAGKHVYNEKPLAVNTRDARKILDLARLKGLRVGAAPDTFLGGGMQTCRKLIDEGRIGVPVAASAFLMCRGHEHWHPQPEFYYDIGGGPMLDMGPYYLTALVNLLGPVRRVAGMARKTHEQRVITSNPRKGKVIQVRVPTHYATVLEFVQGAICSMIMSFDCQGSQLPRMEIYGTDGTLSTSDPNGFGGMVLLKQPGPESWSEIPLTHGYTENCRSIGVADMASAIRNERPHRASGELAFHVLDIMEAAAETESAGRGVELDSSCDRPPALPLGLRDGTVD